MSGVYGPNLALVEGAKIEFKQTPGDIVSISTRTSIQITSDLAAMPSQHRCTTVEGHGVHGPEIVP
jgi:hypothetical protein